jgi:predicted methyltransferase
MKTSNSKKLPAALLTVIVAGLSATASAAPASSAAESIAAAMASTERPESDRAQDGPRKAREFLEFAQVGPGMRVLDAFAAGGYYTELLSRIVGPSGEVIAYNNPEYAEFAAKGIAARYAAGRLPNVRQLTVPVAQLELPPRSLDAVLFVMSFHDLYWRPVDRSWSPTDPQQMLRTLHAALKTGGVVVVQDHVAVPGGDPSAVVDRLHRIDPEVVRREFSKAGFVLEAESPMLANPEDSHALQVFDPDIRGRTDRFVMRFRRPGP